MASPTGDIIARYLKEGAEVEISSNDQGFRGSWYLGTVIRLPGNVSAKVLVEYNTLMEDRHGKRRLREKLELVQLRPPPPPDGCRSFKISDDVDAYYNDGWWEGIITEVLENEKYAVFFRGTREQITFKGSKLRRHREWVKGKWFPPVEETCEVNEVSYEKVPSPAPQVTHEEEQKEYNFSPGKLVEISTDEEGLEGAWFAATVIKKINSSKYLVEYQSLVNDDGDKLLTEETDSKNIRPSPPEIPLVDRYDTLEEVDAYYNDAWWTGVISRVLKDDKYFVYFRINHEELKLKHSDLRVHQDWINGKWVIPPKALEL